MTKTKRPPDNSFGLCLAGLRLLREMRRERAAKSGTTGTPPPYRPRRCRPVVRRNQP